MRKKKDILVKSHISSIFPVLWGKPKVCLAHDSVRLPLLSITNPALKVQGPMVTNDICGERIHSKRIILF